jgi:hypothetical protein
LAKSILGFQQFLRVGLSEGAFLFLYVLLRIAHVKRMYLVLSTSIIIPGFREFLLFPCTTCIFLYCVEIKLLQPIKGSYHLTCRNVSCLPLATEAAANSLPPISSGRWPPLPPLAAGAAGGKGISFLRSVGRVRACLLYCVVGVVGAVPDLLSLHLSLQRQEGGGSRSSVL